MAIENFEIANQICRRVTLQRWLLRNDQNIFAEFKALLKGIRFIRTSAYTVSDITYYTIVTSFISNGFSERVAENTFRQILDGKNSLTPTQPLFEVINIVRTARANISRTIRREITPTPDPQTSTP